MFLSHRPGWWIGAGVLFLCGIPALLSHAAPAAAPTPAGKSAPIDFQRDIRPILASRCWGCHGPGEQKGDLRLDTRAAAIEGGAAGAAIIPGKPGGELLRRISTADPSLLMPPGKPLEHAEIARLRAWIEQGAPWPEEAAGAAVETRHWAFIPPARPAAPKVKNAGWVRTPVDAFILSRLEEKGLSPSPPADRLTLLRRVTFDLTGLPPTPDEIAAFLGDKSPNAYEKVVKRLLASPRYGERWAQHWLDVVRYAETNGFEADGDRPQAWRYRDYVVRSLNEDKPYDQFIKEQVAGDEIAPDRFEARVATGFLRAGPRHVAGGNQDQAANRQEWLTEAVAGVGSAFLGLTISCARCHDHKFDPIPQADYYRLQAFFAGTDNSDFKRPYPDGNKAYDAAVKEHQARLKPLRDEIAALEKPYRERLSQEKREKLRPELKAVLAVAADQRTSEQRQLAEEAQVLLKVEWTELVAALSPEDRERRASLRQRLFALQQEAPEPPPMAPGVAEVKSPAPPTHVLVRGEPHALGEVVQAAFPSALVEGEKGGGADTCGPTDQAGRRRTALAEWLTQPDHPLTTRVMVNRLWHHHFGRGLVATPNDFGRNGQRPTHPELLDWLATEFPRRGWSLKAMHELIVLSNAYRQASTPDPVKAKVDPNNDWFWRMNYRRLDAEAVRDAILAAAGSLNRQAGGPSVRVPLEPEVYATIFTEGEPDTLWYPTPDPSQHTRRSLYLYRKRNVRLPLLVAFDMPDLMTSCGARGQSVHALQALTLLNSDLLREQSRAFARRLFAEAGGKSPQMIDRMYRLAIGRSPKPSELRATENFLRDQSALVRERMAAGEPVHRLEGLPAGTDPALAAAWVDLCLAAFNLNEFAYLK